MFDDILLPIDLNHPESWEKALPMARKLAGESGKVHLLGIVHDLGSAMVATYLPPNFEAEALEKMKEHLDAFAAENCPGDAGVTTHVGHGHVAESVLHIADQIGADLIVMASHKPNDFRTLLVGSNADKVVHHANIPVLVVR